MPAPPTTWDLRTYGWVAVAIRSGRMCSINRHCEMLSSVEKGRR